MKKLSTVPDEYNEINFNIRKLTRYILYKVIKGVIVKLFTQNLTKLNLKLMVKYVNKISVLS